MMKLANKKNAINGTHNILYRAPIVVHSANNDLEIAIVQV